MMITTKTFTKTRTPEQVANEVSFLAVMGGAGYAPILLAFGPDSVTTEYIATEPVTDPDAFLRGCCGLLAKFRDMGIIHGDLTEYNLLVRDNRPLAVDFAESRLARETDRTDKRPGGDAPWLWHAYEALTGDPRRHARRWLAIRERLVLHGVQDVWDFGCGDGGMMWLAQSEGFRARGADRERHAAAPFGIWQGDILSRTFDDGDAALLLSVLPYLFEQAGEDRTAAWMRTLAARVLYVECQSFGDGPGPERFRSQEDVGRWLEQFGTVTPLVSILLPDRGAVRTTFEVALA